MATMKSLALLAAPVAAKVYFKEDFNSAAWKKRWTVGSEWKPAAEMGEWKHTKGEYGVDEGIQTGPDARFFSLTAPLDSEFKNDGKDLVLSYTVKNEQNIDCGGAYIKLLPPGFDAKKFGGETPYSIMFGPDVCGTSTRKTHAIMTYKGKNLLTKKHIRMEGDRLAHRYTLIVRPDNTYEVQIDGVKAEGGSLVEDFDFLAPKTIKDPKASKPADWVDEAEIADPADKKPEGYDDIPAKLPDPAAKKPEDWDDAEDGEWEAPMIDNPDYKGPWVAKKIPNPAYKGPWVHPEIANPEYVEDPKVHAVCNPCGAVGFELWQVKAGTIFDDIIVADDVKEVEAFTNATWGAKKDAEKASFDAIEEAKRKKEEEERKKAEEERKAKEEAEKAAKKEEKEEEKEEDEDDEPEL